MRILAWLDPSRTHETVVSKGKGTLAEGGIFSPCQRRDHLGKIGRAS